MHIREIFPDVITEDLDYAVAHRDYSIIGPQRTNCRDIKKRGTLVGKGSSGKDKV